MEYVVFIGVVIAIIIIAKIFSWPIKMIAKLMINIIAGLVMIYLVNVFAAGVGIYISFNIVTALVAGILGLPGVLVLVILQLIL